jgi:hypothetical protein
MVLAGEFPGWRAGSALPALARMLAAGIRTFVDLTGESDALPPYDAALRQLAEERRIAVEYRRFAIPDMGVPSEELMAEVLGFIGGETAEGRKVYVHCLGGVGRTGTVVGCLLARGGLDGDTALRTVAELFRSCELADLYLSASPQTERQREFVRRWRDTEDDADGQ